MESSDHPTDGYRRFRDLVQPATGDENPETLAKRAIVLFERRLYEKYGVEVHAGVEIECSYRIPRDLRQGLLPAMPEGVRDLFQGRKRTHLQPAGKALDFHDGGLAIPLAINHTTLGLPPREDGAPVSHLRVADNLFPTSPRISHSYRESGGPVDGWVHYEHVITHHGPHDQIPMGEGRFVTLGRAVEVQRRASASTPEDRHHFADDPIHNAWIDKIAHGVTERSTRGQLVDAGNTHGMHFNLSITQGGHNIFAPPNGIHEERAMNFLGAMSNDGEYLLLPSYLARMRGLGQCSDFMFTQTNYFENTKASTESNPYYALLLNLAGIDRMLDKMGYEPQTGHFTGRARTPRNIYNELVPDSPAALLQESRDRFFKPSNPLRAELDALEPNLGTLFTEAIARTPPGQERSAKDAGIVGPMNTTPSR